MFAPDAITGFSYFEERPGAPSFVMRAPLLRRTLYRNPATDSALIDPASKLLEAGSNREALSTAGRFGRPRRTGPAGGGQRAGG